MIDALAFGCMMIALLKHVDRVKIACLAQLVNVIAPIMTETGGDVWKQTIYYPFLHASRYGRGDVFQLAVNSPTYANSKFGAVPMLEATATIDQEHEQIAIFAVNRSQTESLAMEVDLRSLPGYSVIEHLVLDHADPDAVNTVEHPDMVVPRRVHDAVVRDNMLATTVPPLSWNVIRLQFESRTSGDSSRERSMA